MEKRNEHGQTYSEFLAHYQSVKHTFKKPALTADMVMLKWDGTQFYIGMVQRRNHPCIGQWALPGGFFDPATDPSLEGCALRELQEETGVTESLIYPLTVWSNPDRDERDRIVTASYLGIVPPALSPQVELTAGDDAAAAQWFPLRIDALDDLPGVFRVAIQVNDQLVWQDVRYSFRGAFPDYTVHEAGALAFDHGRIILQAMHVLRDQALCGTLPLYFLPSTAARSEWTSLYAYLLPDRRDLERTINRLVDIGALRQKDDHWFTVLP